ncbi:hypothetical protein [Paraburkholderia domus]|uniref:hypothetical protein n=1 Tax=Paraburkholderia domus TaxID=2793075 RepID=UPI001912BDCE|nr:hypothetical protein [Paraburkholderia domus]MBK5061818.1 hypothetical protein [Burkholderia sp. R-70199]CAE6901109.1 hypothetical protein R70199_03698 [Paraburkholderia domus]
MSRTKSVKIGTTAQNATADATADRDAVEALSFPRKLRVTNQMPIALVFPELRLYLIGNTRVPKDGEKNSAEFKFANEDQLKRLEADAEALADIHKYNPAVLIEEIGDDAAVASVEVAAETGVKQTEAPAQDAAPVPPATENTAGAQSPAA